VRHPIVHVWCSCAEPPITADDTPSARTGPIARSNTVMKCLRMTLATCSPTAPAGRRSTRSARRSGCGSVKSACSAVSPSASLLWPEQPQKTPFGPTEQGESALQSLGLHHRLHLTVADSAVQLPYILARTTRIEVVCCALTRTGIDK
jgi:hypothetical protein